MAKRRVKKSGKDKDGDIITVCNPGEHWSPRGKADVIKDIESGLHTYYVEEVYPAVDVHVVERNRMKYLRTDADRYSPNNLDNLPDC